MNAVILKRDVARVDNSQMTLENGRHCRCQKTNVGAKTPKIYSPKPWPWVSNFRHPVFLISMLSMFCRHNNLPLDRNCILLVKYLESRRINLLSCLAGFGALVPREWGGATTSRDQGYALLLHFAHQFRQSLLHTGTGRHHPDGNTSGCWPRTTRRPYPGRAWRIDDDGIWSCEMMPGAMNIYNSKFTILGELCAKFSYILSRYRQEFVLKFLLRYGEARRWTG